MLLSTNEFTVSHYNNYKLSIQLIIDIWTKLKNSNLVAVRSIHHIKYIIDHAIQEYHHIAKYDQNKIDKLLDVNRRLEDKNLTEFLNMDVFKQILLSSGQSVVKCQMMEVNGKYKIKIGSLTIKLGSCDSVLTTYFHNPPDYVSMLLRHHSLMNYYSHWTIPSKVAEHLYEYGFKNDGFGSPLSSVFQKYQDGKYCSLFNEDKMFGSVGRLDDITMSDYDGHWLLCPPHVDGIMTSVVRKILREINSWKNEMKMYMLILPNWTDTEAHELLKDADHVLCSYVIKKQVMMADGDKLKRNMKNRHGVRCYLLGRDDNNIIPRQIMMNMVDIWLNIK